MFEKGYCKKFWCSPSLATSSSFWQSKSLRRTLWGRCGTCGRNISKEDCSGWGEDESKMMQMIMTMSKMLGKSPRLQMLQDVQHEPRLRWGSRHSSLLVQPPRCPRSRNETEMKLDNSKLGSTQQWISVKTVFGDQLNGLGISWLGGGHPEPKLKK